MSAIKIIKGLKIPSRHNLSEEGKRARETIKSMEIDDAVELGPVKTLKQYFTLSARWRDAATAVGAYIVTRHDHLTGILTVWRVDDVKKYG